MKTIAIVSVLAIAAISTSENSVAAPPVSKKIREPVPLELAASNARRSYGRSSNFELSVDGRFIAYSQATDEVVEQRDPGPYSPTGVPRSYGPRTEISIANVSTGRVTRVSGEKGWAWAPVWNPNGEKLAFYSDESGEAGIWIWSRSSNKAVRFPGVIVRPYQSTETAKFSRDGRYILCKVLPKGMTIAEANALFPTKTNTRAAQAPVQEKSPFPSVAPTEPSFIVMLSGESEKEKKEKKEPEKQVRQQEDLSGYAADLVLLDLSRKTITVIAEKSQVRWYAFSPDSGRIVYSVYKDRDLETYQTRYDLISYEIQNKQSKVLQENMSLSYYGDGCTWAPDGKRLACNVTGKRVDKETPVKNEIIIVSTLDGNTKQVGTNLQSISGNARAPLWDTKGENIYVIGTDQTPEKTKDWYLKKRDRLWSIDTRSGTAKVFAELSESQITDVIGSDGGLVSDGDSFVLISASKQGQRGWQSSSALYTVDIKSGIIKLVLDLNSYWSGRQTKIASGKIAYFSSNLQSPGDVWVFDVRKKKKYQVTNTNGEWDRYELGTGRLLDYRGIDGQELHGALLLPPGYKKGQRVPLVVFTFGHPNDSNHINQFGFFGSTASYNMHVLATRGFAVLQPDMPLRTGMQLKDVVGTVIPGVNEAIEQGYVDPDRMAVVGYSIGSYTGLGLVLQNHRFKAAAIGGISVFPDLFAISILGDPRSERASEYEGEQGNAAMGGTLWSQHDRYLNNSTLFLFDQLETPLLMGQGTNDGLAVSNAIFKGLKKLNKEVEYRVYENEDHSISKLPNVIDFWKRRIEFIDEHLDICRDSKGLMVFDGKFARSCRKSKSSEDSAVQKPSE